MIELIQKIKNQQVILFVGSGVSASLGLPTWSQLMCHICDDLGVDIDVFKLYGDNLSLAEYYVQKKGSIGPLRSWMDRAWDISNEQIEKSVIHKLIFNLNIPIIYTTNYDRCLEKTYDCFGGNYLKIKNVEDISNISHSMTQIIKYHGDFDDDSSIVLTESSYFERMDFESSLDIKLKCDILGKSILFIGYSLTDINIRFLLYKINKIWQKNASSDKRPTSYIFLTAPNPVQEAILIKRGIKTIVGSDSDRTKSLIDFLSSLIP